jgi:hypothetical protein
MRTIMLASVALLAAPLASAWADACDDSASRIAAAVPGLTFKARHDPKPPLPGITPDPTVEVHLQHRYRGTIEIICSPSSPPIVTVDTDSAYPSKEFLALVAQIAAAETGVASASIRNALTTTYGAALRKSGDEDTRVGNAEVRAVVYNSPDFRKTQFEITRR